MDTINPRWLGSAPPLWCRRLSRLRLGGCLPLALALLIAGVSCVLVAMVFGVARIAQLRKLARRRHD